MRFNIGLGLLAVCLGGCTAPSCTLDFDKCKTDFECGDSQICSPALFGNDCEQATRCEKEACPAGQSCTQRIGLPAGNPFESATPGKKVCVCNDSYSCDGGYGGGGMGGGGSGGTGGDPVGGGGTGGVPSCLASAPAGDALGAEQFGDVEDEGAPLLAPIAVGAATGTLIAVPFRGAIDLGDGLPLTSAGDTDVALALRDAAGTTLWTANVGNAGPDGLTAMTGLGDQAAVAMSFTGSLDLKDKTLDAAGAPSAAAVFAVPYDSLVPWAFSLVSDGSVTVTALAGGGDFSHVTIAGTFSGKLTFLNASLTSDGGTDGFVANVDVQLGTVVWARQIGGAGDQAISAVVRDDQSGATFVGGDCIGETLLDGQPFTPDARDAFVLGFDAAGQGTVQRRITGPDSQIVSAMALDPTTMTLVVAGVRTSESQSAGLVDFGGGLDLDGVGISDTFLAQMDLDLVGIGVLASIPGAPGTGEVRARALAVDCAGMVTLVGTAADSVLFGNGHGKHDAFVAKLDHGGFLWGWMFGGLEDDAATAVEPLGGEALVVAGTFAGEGFFGTGWQTSAGAQDAFLMILTP